MDAERAEAHLRLLAEAELRRAIEQQPERVHGDDFGIGDDPIARVAQVAHALSGVGALDASIAEAIQADFEFAISIRGPHRTDQVRAAYMRQRIARLIHGGPPGAGMLSFAPIRASSRPGPGQQQHPPVPPRVIPVGAMIPVHDAEMRGELYLLSYAQTASGGRFTFVAHTRGHPRHPPPPLGVRPPPPSPAFGLLTATDEHGTAYRLRFSGSGGHAEWAGELSLQPDPPPGLKWLDIAPSAREPARRIDLSPPPEPAITVVQTTLSPGEYLLSRVAARLLALAPDGPGGPGGIGRGAGLGIGPVIDALTAAGALSAGSPINGQFATLCESVGLLGHGISAAPSRHLPEQWLSLLAYLNRRKPNPPGPEASGCAALGLALPEIDGEQLLISGLHNGEDGTILHVYAIGVAPMRTPLMDGSSLPPLWLRDPAGRWHVAGPHGWNHGGPECSVRLRLFPPLGRADHVEVLLTARSAQARATVPLSWR